MKRLFRSKPEYDEGYEPDIMAEGGNYRKEPQNELQSILGRCVQGVVEKYENMFVELNHPKICYNNEDYLVVQIYGGRNGTGDWITYWKELEQFLIELSETRYDYQGAHYSCDVWVIRLENDCMDDVFTLYIGVK